MIMFSFSSDHNFIFAYLFSQNYIYASTNDKSNWIF